MTKQTRYMINIGLAIFALVVGSGGYYWLKATRPAPEVLAVAPPPLSVEVAPVKTASCTEPIVGYGTIRPKTTVKIVPEVGGKVVFVHQDFAVGNIIPEGELIIEIESTVYESKVTQAEAEIARLETQLRRHNQERYNLENRKRIAIEQCRLAEKSAERERGLLEQGSNTIIETERAEERLLRQKDALAAYESQLAMIPLLIEETEALLKTKRAQLAEARLNVDRTKIYCPFNARVDSVSAHESQVVMANLQIGALTDVEKLELAVVIDPRDLRWTDQDIFASAIGQDIATAPPARVTWTAQGQSVSWTGRVTRLERVDETTRSAHVVIEIQDVMLTMDAGEGLNRPPLSVGMFCQAELPGATLEDALLIPRHAVYERQFVYVYEPSASRSGVGRLSIKRVPVLRTIGDNVLVSYRSADGTVPGNCELAPGDRLIVSPVPKAVGNMPLRLRGGREMARAATEAAAEVQLAGSEDKDDKDDVEPLLGSVMGVR